MDLLENPLHVLLLGGFFTCLFGAIWWSTARRELFFATVATILLTAVGLFVERRVVTPRESVVNTLEEIAGKIGDVEPLALLDYIHSSAPEIRERARSQLNYYQLAEGKITQVYEVNVDENVSPPRAVTKFNASVLGGLKSGEISNRRVVQYFIVTLEQENGNWKVLHYEHHDPQTPLRSRE